MELVSVIVPVYNSEIYLDRCISSIVNQTFNNIEIILVDDGSTDKSLDICKNWAVKDQRIKVIHQQNSGVSISRNTGIMASHGEYIIQLDSDDYLSKYMIEHMYEAIKKNNTDMVICDFEKGTEEFYDFECVIGENENIDSHEALTRMYVNDWNKLRYVVPWAKLYKKELFEGIQYPAGKIFEDIYITHQLIAKCKSISVLNEKLVYYYQRTTSIMNSRLHVGKLDYLDALLDRIEFFEKQKWYDLKNQAYDEYLHCLIWEYSRVRDILHDNQLKKEMHQRFKGVYQKGYSSINYPDENRTFLYGFYLNPEIIVLYWRITTKLRNTFKR